MNPISARILTIAALSALSLPLAGCGNRGPLVLAPPPASAQAPALNSPPATEPTDSEMAPEIQPPPAADPASGTPLPAEPDPDGDG